MILIMFLMTACVIGVMLGLWQDLNRTIETEIQELLDELRFNPDHATQYDNTDSLLNVSFDVYAKDYIEDGETDYTGHFEE